MSGPILLHVYTQKIISKGWSGPPPPPSLSGSYNEIDITALDRQIDQSKEAFEQADNNFKILFPTFGGLVTSYLKNKGNTSAITWEMLTDLVAQLESPTYYILTVNGVPTFSLLPADEILFEYSQPIEAINHFFTLYQKVTQFEKEKKGQLTALSKKINQGKSYLNKTTNKLEQIKTSTNYEVIANIIMANLHNIAPYSKEVRLLNFYNNEQLTIKLNAKITPQKNAENYYRKAKNQKIEINNLEETLKKKNDEVSALQLHFTAIQGLQSVKDIRNYTKGNALETTKAVKQIAMPYYAFHYKGYDIWVGKNAKNNDILTQKLAWKEDLWLHAKDVSGSHVVIKHQSGKQFPKKVIEAAAQLAAYYSKRKTDSLCPVIVTPKKFVRKRKGAPPGAVVVDKEDVVLVEPKQL